MDSINLMDNERLGHALSYAKRKADEYTPHANRGAGLVYIVECRGYVKFGVSQKPKRRLTLLQTGCPFQLTLLATFHRVKPYKTEDKIHLKLHRYHVRGEWFDVPTEVMESLLRSLEHHAI